MNKSRAGAGRPIIAVRTLHSPDAIYAREHPNTCAAPGSLHECDVQPGNQKQREVFVDEDGDEYVELLPGDNIDFPTLEEVPTPSLSMVAEALATAVVDIEEEMEDATPGLAIAAGLLEPTKALL